MKVEALDVLATWKILSAMVFTPILFSVYVSAVCVYASLQGWSVTDAGGLALVFIPAACWSSVRAVGEGEGKGGGEGARSDVLWRARTVTRAHGFCFAQRARVRSFGR